MAGTVKSHPGESVPAEDAATPSVDFPSPGQAQVNRLLFSPTTPRGGQGQPLTISSVITDNNPTGLAALRGLSGDDQGTRRK